MDAEMQGALQRLKQSIRDSALGPIEEPEPGWIGRRYRFVPGFLGFTGHFPGYPILPAVIQIATALSLIEEHSREALRLVSVENAKFLLPIRPDQEIEVRCRRRSSDEGHNWEARLGVEGNLAASFVLVLAPGGAAR